MKAFIRRKKLSENLETKIKQLTRLRDIAMTKNDPSGNVISNINGRIQAYVEVRKSLNN